MKVEVAIQFGKAGEQQILLTHQLPCFKVYSMNRGAFNDAKVCFHCGKFVSKTTMRNTPGYAHSHLMNVEGTPLLDTSPACSGTALGGNGGSASKKAGKPQ